MTNTNMLEGDSHEKLYPAWFYDKSEERDDFDIRWTIIFQKESGQVGIKAFAKEPVAHAVVKATAEGVCVGLRWKGKVKSNMDKLSSLILDILEQFLIKKKQTTVDIINFSLKDQINPLAQIIIRCCYRFGKWVEKDEHKAFIYHQKSTGMRSSLGFYEIAVSEMGNANGTAGVGFCYNYGIGVEKDEHKAFIYYQKAVEMGYSKGAYKIGNCYQYGIRAEKIKIKHSLLSKISKDAYLEIEDDLKKIFIKSKYQLAWISFNEFKNIEKIGRGSFATVYHAK
ncbi:hypothetical protein C2G38_2174997 [Gigaspora rosea]|uniref:Protein kinase domain-containing protein n=1 Tax=Gigaspora rosea TaxID=44941 RepID=A0A397VQ33_9GLOM|nr:hypothetical protein C2G38_2174997 [Gigaspora rosea]